MTLTTSRLMQTVWLQEEQVLCVPSSLILRQLSSLPTHPRHTQKLILLFVTWMPFLKSVSKTNNQVVTENMLVKKETTTKKKNL